MDSEPNIEFPEMSSLNARIASFESKPWPHQGFAMLHPIKLAEAGFFYDPAPDGKDRCCCFACGLPLVNWDPNDNPFAEHLKHGETPESARNYKCVYVELLKKYNPLVFGLDKRRKSTTAEDGLPEVDEVCDPCKALEIKENFNMRRDYLKSILISSMYSQEYRRPQDE